jgi:putative endonuclease
MVGHLMQFIYVLKSQRDNNLYIGCTADINKRISEHNTGKVLSTKGRRPFQLIFQEKFENKYEAFNKERYYKTAKGKKELKNKIINYCEIV